ncbi:glutaredoxin family protein [Bacillus xiapuensis]|uniref:glutaredoxin family protein n=1 Tax=Bacillus xiapuensis TaxID=2014075 RepID=UPI000C230B16|nr:glutaredoxin family protein [Bacillus xiapuensis]
MKEIFFYTRPSCHLCEEAKGIVQLVQEELDLAVHECNIDECEEWTERYGMMIPVVEYKREIIQYGRIDYPALKKKLK